MGLMETSLMRQVGKLVEVVRHAYEILGGGYRYGVRFEPRQLQRYPGRRRYRDLHRDRGRAEVVI